MGSGGRRSSRGTNSRSTNSVTTGPGKPALSYAISRQWIMQPRPSEVSPGALVFMSRTASFLATAMIIFCDNPVHPKIFLMIVSAPVSRCFHIQAASMKRLQSFRFNSYYFF
jgi:hypothetical protein